MPLFSGFRQYDVAKREKGEQCHIVRNEHGADERDVHKGKDRTAQIFRHRDDPAGDTGEKADMAERADHRQCAEEAGQRARIEITEIGLIRRHENGGGYSENGGDAEHGVLLHEGGEPLGESDGFCRDTRMGRLHDDTSGVMLRGKTRWNGFRRTRYSIHPENGGCNRKMDDFAVFAGESFVGNAFYY